MNTISFNKVKESFQSIAGLASLDALDEFFFRNSLNSRLKDAWSRADWPELIELTEVSIGSDSTGEKVGALTGFDVLDVWNKNPYLNRTATKLNYRLIDSKIYINVDEPIYDGKIHVLSKKQFADYDESSTDIPAFFENYLISAILSDFYRGDGQGESAQAEDNRSEEYLLRQMDRVERIQQQNKPTILQYNSVGTNTLIYQ